MALLFHRPDAGLQLRRAAIKGRFPWYGLLLLVLSVNAFSPSQQNGLAGESSADPEKLAIIQLIEDRLATARTIRTREDAPDFGTLDRIYPEWHHGEPATKRRQWTFHDYLYYMVSYSVHSVWINRPETAVVKGKKKIQSLRRKKFLKFFHRRERETVETQFEITCRRNPSGEWVIVKGAEYQGQEQVTSHKLRVPKVTSDKLQVTKVPKPPSDKLLETNDE